jgi:secondary thiamine-phosphate synthase enzyme
VQTLELRTETKSSLIEITADVAKAVAGAHGSAVLVYVPHTTAAVTINEKIDPVLLADLDRALTTVGGDPAAFEHDDEDGPNGTSHLRSTLVGPQLLVPLKEDGSLALGTYQGIFFCEFDGPRDRRVHISVLQ